MNALDQRLEVAAADLLHAVAGWEPARLPDVRSTSPSPRRLLVVSVCLALGVLAIAGLAALRHDAEPPLSTDASAAERDLLVDHLEGGLVDALASIGIEAALPFDLTKSTAEKRDDGSWLVEVRLRADGGDVTASVSLGRPDPAAGMRPDPIAMIGGAPVYIGVDSPTARAVELVRGDRIIYVRVENTEAPSIDDLLLVVGSLDQEWMNFGPA